MNSKLKVALIIPCFEFETHIESTLKKIENFKKTLAYDFKVVFVDDGSSDKTYPLIERLKKEQPWIVATRLEKNQGKGAAIQRGFAEIKNWADYAVFSDCDLHYGLQIIADRILPALENSSIAIVDRSWIAGIRHQTFLRNLASGIFNRAMSILTGVNYRDSQAGLKGFRVDDLTPVFDLLTMKGFTFDVELLSIALYYRMKIVQIPIDFEDQYRFPTETSVKILTSSLTMLLDLIRINLNWKKNLYRSTVLEEKISSTVYKIKN